MSLRRFATDARGNIAVLFAVGFALSAMIGAIAVDAAALYYERRTIQNGVDLAALAAAADTSQASSIARASLVEAGLLKASSTAGLTVTPGHYNPDPNLPSQDRFRGGQIPLNAVRVTFEREGHLNFAQGWAPPPMIGATAIATVTPEVSFSIGSRLAGLNEGVVNALLGPLLGGKVSLSLMDYNSLLNAKVDIFTFLDALAVKLNLSAGTYNELLAANASGGILASALQAVLTGTEQVAASKLVASVGQGATVALSKLFELGGLGDLKIGSSGGKDLFAGVSALEIITAAAGIANGGKQVGLALSAGLPGLLGIDAQLAIGEPPQGAGWYAVGAVGTVVRTAQLRLKLLVKVLGSGVLLDVPIRLPIYIEAAHSEATVAAAACPTATNRYGSATILTRPGALRVILGEVSASSFGNFNTAPVIGLADLLAVKLLGITVLEVQASSLIEIAQTTPVPLNFSSSDIASGTLKTAKTSTPISSLTNSLLSNLKLYVPILGLGLNLSSLTILLKAIISPLAPVLDLVVNSLLKTVGLSLGEADVRVYGVRCTHPVLVG